MPKVIVIGGGAAGSMAAIFAASGGAETVLLESTRDGGRKILISGGGRCNVLPASVDESRFVTDSSPNVLRKLVRAWPLAEQRRFFEETLGIPLVEETESLKLFPASHKARDVRDGLLARARAAGVQLQTETRVTAIEPAGGRWTVRVEDGAPLAGDAVVVATGGLSVPATGSDGAGLAMLAGLGHVMHPTYAALTPLTSDASQYSALSGISLRVALTATSAERGASARGGFLFTHRGYSGPAVLDVSHVLVRARADASSSARLRVQWTEWGDAEWHAALTARGTRSVLGVVRTQLPDRLAAVLVEEAGVDPSRALPELRRDERRRLIDVLVRGSLPWQGDEGYKKAEVTGGGVALGEVHPQTLESRRHRALFLCGEVLDAFGPIGGYNFLWAWATGRVAGIAAAAAVRAPAVG